MDGPFSLVNRISKLCKMMVVTEARKKSNVSKGMHSSVHYVAETGGNVHECQASSKSAAKA